MWTLPCHLTRRGHVLCLLAGWHPRWITSPLTPGNCPSTAGRYSPYHEHVMQDILSGYLLSCYLTLSPEVNRRYVLSCYVIRMNRTTFSWRVTASATLTWQSPQRWYILWLPCHIPWLLWYVLCVSWHIPTLWWYMLWLSWYMQWLRRYFLRLSWHVPWPRCAYYDSRGTYHCYVDTYYACLGIYQVYWSMYHYT